MKTEPFSYVYCVSRATKNTWNLYRQVLKEKIKGKRREKTVILQEN